MNLPEWLTSAAWLFGLPLLVSGVLTALLIRLAPRLGLIEHPGERKVHTRPTPRGGGLAVFVAVLVGAFCTLPLSSVLLPLLLAAAIVLLGLLDDLRPQPWQLRLSVQLAVAVLTVLFCLPPASWPVRIVLVLWIAGLVNAFNMLDNMDALSGGVAWIATGFLAAALAPAVVEWGPFVVLMGALSGFLWFNRPPARIFLGDAGSTFLGFILGLGGARLALRADAPPWSPLVPLCILAVPCYDLLTVVLLRLSQGHSPFHADKQHLSHRLAAQGRSNAMAVGLIYVLALASGASGLILYAVTDWPAALGVVGQLGLWWLALAGIEFAVRSHPAITKEICHDPQVEDRAGADGSAGR